MNQGLLPLLADGKILRSELYRPYISFLRCDRLGASGLRTLYNRFFQCSCILTANDDLAWISVRIGFNSLTHDHEFTLIHGVTSGQHTSRSAFRLTFHLVCIGLRSGLIWDFSYLTNLTGLLSVGLGNFNVCNLTFLSLSDNLALIATRLKFHDPKADGSLSLLSLDDLISLNVFFTPLICGSIDGSTVSHFYLYQCDKKLATLTNQGQGGCST